MAWEPKEGAGSGFLNEKKQPGEKTPDYRLEFLYEGKRIEVALWASNETGRNDLPKRFSGKIGPAKPRHEKPAAKAEPDLPEQPGKEQFSSSDEIPF